MTTRVCKHDTKDSFSVITFNIFIGPPCGSIELARFRKQAAFLRDEAADVYCLQEVFSPAIIGIFEEELGAHYNMVYGKSDRARIALKYVAQCFMYLLLAVLLRFLAHLGNISRRHSLFLSLICGGLIVYWLWRFARRRVLWAFLWGSIPGGLVVMYRKESAQMCRHDYHSFKVQGGDFMNVVRRRGYLCSKLVIRGKPVTIVNAHTNAFPTISIHNAEPVPSVERAAQLHQACAEADCIGKDEGCIVAGDFNTNPEDNEIPAKMYGLVNCWSSGDLCVTLPLTATLKHVFPETERDLCSDYQFSKALTIDCAKVLQTGDLSDHLPVKAIYQLK